MKPLPAEAEDAGESQQGSEGDGNLLAQRCCWRKDRGDRCRKQEEKERDAPMPVSETICWMGKKSHLRVGQVAEGAVRRPKLAQILISHPERRQAERSAKQLPAPGKHAKCQDERGEEARLERSPGVTRQARE